MSGKCDCALYICANDEGFMVCTNCGVVSNTVLDTTPEWRYTNKDGSKNTKAIRGGTSSSTVYVGTDKRTSQVHLWNSTTTKERWELQIKLEFEKLDQATLLGKNITSTACDLFRETQKVKRCSNRDGMKAACIYFACRDLQVPREKDEIMVLFKSSKSIINKGVSTFLDLVPRYRELPPLLPLDFAGRFCELVNFQHTNEVINIINKLCMETNILNEFPPTWITAACIKFIASFHKLVLSKETIHSKFRVSNASVGKVTKFIIINS